MPRTRIRSTRPGGTGVGVGTGSATNPPGSSLTYDGFSIKIIIPDTVTTPTDSATFAVRTTTADTATTPTETQAFKVTNAVTDTATTPTGSHSTAILAGATTVTQTVGTGWTTPTNAQGLSDTAVATITNTTTTAKTGTLVGSYTNILSATGSTEQALENGSLAFRFSVAVGTLASASINLSYSTDGGTNYTSIGNYTAATNGLTTAFVSLSGITLANLANVRFRAVGSATGSAIGSAATVSLDSVVANFNTPGAAG